MTRLNIFVDETGEFGFLDGCSDIYGVSFTFHEHDQDITPQIKGLNDRLNRIGYTDMIHMADLIMRRGDYVSFNLDKRKKIFNAIFEFTRRVPIRYCTILIDKKYTDNSSVLSKKIINEVGKMINEGYEHRIDFDHKEKRLFQVSDMLTYIDKAIYKNDNKLKYSKSEKFFFSNNDLRRIEKKINKKRF